MKTFRENSIMALLVCDAHVPLSKPKRVESLINVTFIYSIIDSDISQSLF